MKIRVIVGLLVAGAATAGVSCSDPVSPAPATVEISLSVDAAAPTLTLLVALNGRTSRVVVDSGARCGELQVRTPRIGKLPVRVDLLSATGDTIATAEFQEEFRADYANSIGALVASGQLIQVCRAAPAFTIPTALPGTPNVYISYGGVPKDVVVC